MSSASKKEIETKVNVLIDEESEEEENTFKIHVHETKNEEGTSNPKKDMPSSPSINEQPSLNFTNLVNVRVQTDWSNKHYQLHENKITQK